jgi:hypothetical protein
MHGEYNVKLVKEAVETVVIVFDMSVLRVLIAHAMF